MKHAASPRTATGANEPRHTMAAAASGAPRHAAPTARHAAGRHAASGATRRERREARTEVLSVVDARELLLKEINEGPQTRREYRERQKRANRKSNAMLAGAATALLGTAASLCAANAAGFAPQVSVSPALAQEVTPSDTTVDLSNPLAARSENRAESISTSSAAWDGEDVYGEINVVTLSSRNLTLPEGTQTATGIWQNKDLLLADSADVQRPASVDHATGDTGNAYSYGQCTWWAYIRRHQLGLPVGSHFGNGAQWAASARSLGYAVDNNPQVGDIVVFGRGQAQASSRYGHVAIVEAVIDDKIVISESNPSGRTPGTPTSRTLANIHAYQYIHS